LISVGGYRHYKGGHYNVLYVARHSETEEHHVVYQALYGDYGYWVRPLSLFCDSVTHNGQNVKRFEKICTVKNTNFTNNTNSKG